MTVDKPINISDRFENPPAQIDYVLPNMVAGSVGALVSPGGAGKSMLALQLASQIAGGPDLLGLGGLPSGSVVYLPVGEPRLVIRHRVHALGKHLNSEERQIVAANVLIHPLISSPRNIMDSEGYARLERFAEGRRLMILDTLRRFHFEDENTGSAMILVLERMERITAQTGCSIVFLHHMSNESVPAGGVDQPQASRESSVLTDHVRWHAYLAGMASDEARKLGVNDTQRHLFVRFGMNKVNYGSFFPDKWLQRYEGGVLKSTVLSKEHISFTIPRMPRAEA